MVSGGFHEPHVRTCGPLRRKLQKTTSVTAIKSGRSYGSAKPPNNSFQFYKLLRYRRIIDNRALLASFLMIACALGSRSLAKLCPLVDWNEVRGRGPNALQISGADTQGVNGIYRFHDVTYEGGLKAAMWLGPMSTDITSNDESKRKNPYRYYIKWRQDRQSYVMFRFSDLNRVLEFHGSSSGIVFTWAENSDNERSTCEMLTYKMEPDTSGLKSYVIDGAGEQAVDGMYNPFKQRFNDGRERVIWIQDSECHRNGIGRYYMKRVNENGFTGFRLRYDDQDWGAAVDLYELRVGNNDADVTLDESRKHWNIGKKPKPKLQEYDDPFPRGAEDGASKATTVRPRRRNRRRRPRRRPERRDSRPKPPPPAPAKSPVYTGRSSPEEARLRKAMDTFHDEMKALSQPVERTSAPSQFTDKSGEPPSQALDHAAKTVAEDLVMKRDGNAERIVENLHIDTKKNLDALFPEFRNGRDDLRDRDEKGTSAAIDDDMYAFDVIEPVEAERAAEFANMEGSKYDQPGDKAVFEAFCIYRRSFVIPNNGKPLFTQQKDIDALQRLQKEVNLGHKSTFEAINQYGINKYKGLLRGTIKHIVDDYLSAKLLQSMIGIDSWGLDESTNEYREPSMRYNADAMYRGHQAIYGIYALIKDNIPKDLLNSKYYTDEDREKLGFRNEANL